MSTPDDFGDGGLQWWAEVGQFLERQHSEQQHQPTAIKEKHDEQPDSQGSAA